MMNGDQLAEEIINAMGGRKTKLRRELFRKMCWAIIRHVQANGEVNTQGADPQGGIVVSTGKVR